MVIVRKIIGRFLNYLRKIINWPNRLIDNIVMFQDKKHLKCRPKIIYVLTPPSRLKNIGDHAQVVAIRNWMAKHFSNYPIIELDKDEIFYYRLILKWLVTDNDIFFIHSGGNLNDRSMWSETRRRFIIKNFRNNKIISLPQTIYFTDTKKGRKERRRTQKIYSKHLDLTVVARDPKSYEIAKDLFPFSNLLCIPDFVLSLEPAVSRPFAGTKKNNISVLFCFREDFKSIIKKKQIEYLMKSIKHNCKIFNTEIDNLIVREKREEYIKKTLDLFQNADAVVTDRFHGLIFAVLCRKPCVICPTVEHKLPSGLLWFEGAPFIKKANNVEEIPWLLEEVLQAEIKGIPDWNKKYFDNLSELLKLK